MEAWERIEFIIEREGMNKNSFSNAIGISNNVTITRIINEHRTPSRATCEKIVSAFPSYNLQWVLTGEGEMLNNSNPVPKYNEAVPIQQDVVYIPLVNQFAYAGYLDGYSDCTYLEQLPKVPFIVDHEGHGNYIAFEVKGDSMNNGTEESYLEGDRLYCREIQPHLWATSKLHLRKWDFVIVHEDGIVVKRIIDPHYYNTFFE